MATEADKALARVLSDTLVSCSYRVEGHSGCSHQDHIASALAEVRAERDAEIAALRAERDALVLALPPGAKMARLEAMNREVACACSHADRELQSRGLQLRHVKACPRRPWFCFDQQGQEHPGDAERDAEVEKLRAALREVRSDMTPTTMQYGTRYLRQFIESWSRKIDAALAGSSETT